MIKVAAGILIDQQNILIARRSPGKDLAGYWEFPGGKIEANETPEAALIREFREEFQVEIKVLSPFHQNQHSYASKTILLDSYLAEHVSGEFQLRDHDQLAWVSIPELDNYQISPADKPIVEKLRTLQNTKGFLT
ncbi:8-oxo-dGTP diphosphatase MutT [Mangrovimonas sp. YM274]|uniref:8-oxo-dGTP diphosphatase MutT n=1 Tax=Mangrovimonas sp. YM274 TaxID=3070660 RepID=UPI0027DAE795|nr:8-oxo-dGTP diphosphatase MutT [Mangrovimonas sp. YM274]WMI69024.1 8-oxo-dGTP diphosphatase MutT [Mangrovimonas sp. YM274]